MKRSDLEKGEYLGSIVAPGLEGDTAEEVNANWNKWAAPWRVIERRALDRGHGVALHSPEAKHLRAQGVKLALMVEHGAFWLPGYAPDYTRPAAEYTPPGEE